MHSDLSSKMLAPSIRQMVEALRNDRIDEAETLWENISHVFPQARTFLVFPVLIAIQRGRIQEALHLIEANPDIPSPDLKALCLYLLGEPSWHGYASDLVENSDDPCVREAMRRLLDQSSSGAC